MFVKKKSLQLEVWIASSNPEPYGYFYSFGARTSVKIGEVIVYDPNKSTDKIEIMSKEEFERRYESEV